MSTRRQFLITAGAFAAATAMPIPAIPASPASAVGHVAGPDLLAFAVGTPGEYDWQHIIASSAEEAWRIWSEENGLSDGEDPGPADWDYVTRVPSWDGKTETTSADWFRAGMGHVCDRCGYETSPDQCGRIVGEDVICEDCLTWADCLAINEHEEVVDEIADRLGDEPEEDVRYWLASEGIQAKVDELGLFERARALIQNTVSEAGE